MLTATKVINESGIAFGTSGARGLVVDFTHNVCAAFAHAFLQVTRDNFEFKTVALAIDNRPSSYEIAQACAAAIKQQGFEIEYHGVIPTPALAYYAMQNDIPCIMVTGSHIPFDRNGLKFYRPDGEISKDDELAIVGSAFAFPPVEQLPELQISPLGAERYVSRYTSLYADKILAGKRIGIYEHSSAGRDLYALLFQQLGAEVISLGRSDEFVPIDTEAVSDEDRLLAKGWAEQFKLDAIFSTDGDGDRPLISDETGNWLRGDILGLLTASELGIDALAVPVSCNTAIELSNKFKSVVRTKIGSPYVIAAFDSLAIRYSTVAGFEANGGFLLASDLTINGNYLGSLPTRDAVLPALMLLAASRNKKISELVDQLPQRFTWSDRLKDFPSQKGRGLIECVKDDIDSFLRFVGMSELICDNVDMTDGIRLTFNNNDVFHIRVSGNAPELRCYAEAGNESLAEKYVNVILAAIKYL